MRTQLRELHVAVLNALDTLRDSMPKSAVGVFDALLLEPLLTVAKRWGPPPKALVLVVDALDESVTGSSGTSDLIALMRDRFGACFLL